MFQPKLGLYALTLEGAAWLQLSLASRDDAALLLYLGMHAGASALFSLLAVALLPQRLAQPRRPMLLLMFAAGYAVPVLGFIGILAGIYILRRLPVQTRAEFFRPVRLPELDPHQRMGAGFRQAGLRSFLANDKAPVASRLRALVTLQNVSGRVAAPLLRDVLANPSEDIRLLAYGLLERQEKRLNQSIHQENKRFASHHDGSPGQAAAARRLSDLYWELVYQELAQGDLRLHALEQSLRYTQLALARTPDDAALLLRHGRLVKELGNPGKARLIYEQALALGLPKTRVIPYLAEAAYDLGDYRAARFLMAELGGWQSLPRLRPVIDYWRGP